MERLIDGARHSIRFESYLVRPGGPGAVAAGAALLRAAQRGVAVTVLVDAYGSEELPSDYFEVLAAAGAQVHWFNPLRLLRLSFRNHRKLLTCDGGTAIVGGFNIAPEYAGDGVSRGWLDIGLLIEGPVVAELEAGFDAMVSLAPFTPTALRSFRARYRSALPAAHADVHPEVKLLQSGPPLAHNRLRRALRRDLRGAQAIRVVSGYFLPPFEMRRLLHRCVRHGGTVQLLLAGRSDVGLAKLAAERLYRRLLRRKIRISEYRPQVLHAKLLVIDDIVHIGSCNIDRRSLHINFELLLRLDWPELAADARQWVDESLRHSRPVRLAHWRRQRTLWRRLLSRLAYVVLARIDPFIARRRFRALG